MVWLKVRFKVLSAIFLVAGLSFVTIGCASSGGSFIPEYENKISGNDNLTLESYLRRLNGVEVSGSGRNITVSIRGNMSSKGVNDQPLYVVNDHEIGHSYVKVLQLVRQNTISSVEAISASRAALYGSNGGSGVIVIKTTP